MKKNIFISFSISIGLSCSAQFQIMHYNLKQIPQTYQWNPALIPQYKFYWGTTTIPFALLPTPVVNYIYFNKGTAGPALVDFFTHKGDSVQINNNAASLAKKYNYTYYTLEVGLLSFGMKIKDINYFHFYSTLKNNFWSSYTQDFIKFLIEGNGGNNTGHNFDMSIKASAHSYMETGFSFSRELKEDKLTVGGTLKIYNGIANLQTKKNKTTFLTGDTAFEYIGQSDITLNMCSLYDSSANKFKFGNALKNLGLGIDVGANYTINDQWSINAAIIDIGYVKYKTNPYNYSFNDKFYFPGIDLKKIISDTIDIDQAIKDLQDSLGERYKYAETHNNYIVWMPTKVNIQGIYNINEKHSLSGIIQTTFFDKKPHLAGSLGYVFRPNRWFNASISYQIYNRYYSNIGLGFALNLGMMQWYIMTDNLLGFTRFADIQFTTKDNNTTKNINILYPSSRNINIRTGCNWTFGAKPKDRDKDGVPDKKDVCPDNYGLAIYLGCPDSDNDSIPDKDDKCPNIAGLKTLQGCPDKDKDGITDLEDSCPDDSGLVEFKGCPDKDGDKIIDKEDDCPEEAGLVEFKGCPDKDNDKIPDRLDDCPDLAGDVKFQGCPDKDNDEIIDPKDNCPDVFGPKENNGCPWADTDKDGIVDKDDACPDKPGVPELKGCPPAPKLTAKEEKIIQKAFSNLEFETGKSIIRPKSFPSLNELAGLLKQHPDWTLVLSGHTDNQGDPKKNMILSEKRAKAVANYLVKKGVKAENITTEWFGDTKPIADNSTPQGRQKNRRVEMKIQYKEVK